MGNTRINGIILSLLVLLTFLSSCNSEPNIPKYNYENVYSVKIIENNSEYIKSGNVYLHDNYIYVVYTNTIEPKKAAIQSFDLNGGDVKLDEINLSTTITNVFVLNDGSYIVISSIEYNNHTLIHIKDNENTVLIERIQDLLGVSTYIEALCLSTDNLLYIQIENMIYKLSLDTFEYTTTNIENKIFITKTHETNDGSIIFESPGYEYYTINEENKFVSYKINNLPEYCKNNWEYRYDFGDGYDIYLNNNTGVYGYNHGDKDADLLVNWVNSDILYYDIFRPVSILKVISPDKVLCVKGTIGNQQLMLLTRIPDDEIIPKSIISLAHTISIQDTVYPAVIHFNMTNDKYRYE